MLGSLLRNLGRIPVEESLLKLANRLHHGRLTLTIGDGVPHLIDSGMPGPAAEIHLIDPRAVMRRYLSAGALGFSESYIEGEWDSPDLASILELLDRNQDAWGQGYFGGWLSRQVGRFHHLGRPNSKSGSKRNIHAHYDLGNAFFENWLDPGMTYSAALFEAGEHSLDQAQPRKYRKLAQALDIKPNDRVLEIGCGWGGFAELVAKEFDADLTCVTISKEQHAYASARIQKAGLNDKVDVRLQDYRDVEGPFDRIASIEMFEAVGERYWPVFFDRLKTSLAPAGRAGLQIITIADHHFDNYRRNPDFIQRYIFPGGMLPSPKVLHNRFRSAGLEIVDELAFGEHYAKTLAIWADRFESTWSKITNLGFDERFRRIWRYYLAYCEAGFRTGSTDVRQIVLKPN